MPSPIRQVSQNNILPSTENMGLLELIINPLVVLQDSVSEKRDRENLKQIWIKSQTTEEGKLKVSQSIKERDLLELKGKGLIEGEGRVVAFTERGHKMLKDSILEDEKSSMRKSASLVKKASNKMVAKNSYDFGNEVLVRVKDKDKFGARYVTLPKTAFAKKKATPQLIEKYKIATKKEDGSVKKLQDYSEYELVQILHLAKNIINNKKIIEAKMTEKNNMFYNLPANRIKEFSVAILKELNSR